MKELLERARDGINAALIDLGLAELNNVAAGALARAALLAALDPEDEALVEEFARGRWLRRYKHASSMDWHVQKAEIIMHPGVQNSVAAEIASAKQDIAALQNFADASQGVSGAPADQVEKD